MAASNPVGQAGQGREVVLNCGRLPATPAPKPHSALVWLLCDGNGTLFCSKKCRCLQINWHTAFSSSAGAEDASAFLAVCQGRAFCRPQVSPPPTLLHA